MSRLWNAVTAAVVVSVGLVLTGCSDVTGAANTTAQEAALERALTRWRTTGSASYSFKSTISCYCTLDYRAPKTVTVRNGAIVSVADRVTGAAEPIGGGRLPIDSLFALVRDALADRPFTSNDVVRTMIASFNDGSSSGGPTTDGALHNSVFTAFTVLYRVSAPLRMPGQHASRSGREKSRPSSMHGPARPIRSTFVSRWIRCSSSCGRKRSIALPGLRSHSIRSSATRHAWRIVVERSTAGPSFSLTACGRCHEHPEQIA